MPVLRPRMTLQGGMIAIAFVALALSLAIECRRADNRHGPGYDRARAVFALRGSRRTSGGYGGEDLYGVIGVAAVAWAGVQLRRRSLRAS